MRKRLLLGNIAAVAAMTLVLWLVGGTRRLPITATAYHWGRAWLVFDCAMVDALALSGWFGVHRSRWAVPFLAASGTLLLIDAWFDVCTSPPGIELRLAVVDAFLEVSMAILCLLPAFRLPPVASAAPAAPAVPAALAVSSSGQS